MATKKAQEAVKDMRGWVPSYQRVAPAFKVLDGDRKELLAELSAGLKSLLGASVSLQANGTKATHVSLSNECGVSSSQIGRDLVAAKYLQDKPLADAYQVKLITDRGTSLVTMLAAADLSALLAVARAARPAAIKAAKEAADAKAAKVKDAAVKAEAAKVKAAADAKAVKDAAELAAKNAAELAAELAAETAKADAELAAASNAARAAEAKVTRAKTDMAKVKAVADAKATATALAAAEGYAKAATERQTREAAKVADAAKAATPAAPPAAPPTPRTGGEITITQKTFSQTGATVVELMNRIMSDCLAGKVKESEWNSYMGTLTTAYTKSKAVKFAPKKIA